MSTATARMPLLEGMHTVNQSATGVDQPDDVLVVPNDGGLNEVKFAISKRLYISHSFSAWNSRFFEFGATIFLATIFPGSLLPTSVYALTRSLSAILFSPAVGRYIDNNNRLVVVRFSIGEFQFFIDLTLANRGIL